MFPTPRHSSSHLGTTAPAALPAGGDTPPASMPGAGAPTATAHAPREGAREPEAADSDPGSPRPAVPIATRDLATRGARIRFAEAGSGPPLLLVHDYLESRLSWDEVMAPLAKRFRVIVPDLPGFGESEKPPAGKFRYGPAAFADALIDLLSAVGATRASICGQGLGGAIALTMAAHHAEAIDKLVLVAPAVTDSPRDGATLLSAMPIVGPIFYKQVYGRRLFRRHFQGKMHRRDLEEGPRPPGSAESVRTERLFRYFDTPAGRQAAYATMMALLDTRTLRASLGRVTAPTLILCGRTGGAFSVADGRRLSRELARARLESFDCGAFPAEEMPEAFAVAVTGFLAATSENER